MYFVVIVTSCLRYWLSLCTGEKLPAVSYSCFWRLRHALVFFSFTLCFPPRHACLLCLILHSNLCILLQCHQPGLGRTFGLQLIQIWQIQDRHKCNESRQLLNGWPSAVGDYSDLEAVDLKQIRSWVVGGCHYNDMFPAPGWNYNLYQPAHPV